MTDNISVTPGIGATVATDDVGGVQYQRIKSTWGVAGTAADVTLSDPLPVQVPTQITDVDRSGMIVAGGTAQQLMPANTSRRGFWLQNQSTGDLWISTVGIAAAMQPSLWLNPGAYYESPVTGVPTATIWIFGAVTGQTFAAREW